MQQNELRWYHLSACQGIDLNYFYDKYEGDPVVAQTVDSICATCPVRELCRREGEENDEVGVWGGVYLINGKPDPSRNQHKTNDMWDIVNDYCVSIWGWSRPQRRTA